MKLSPLRYPGGKTRAVKILETFLPENTKSLTSPFFGGGSFEIYLSRKGIEIIGFDVLDPLVAFWQQLKINRDVLIKEIGGYFPCEKETFYALQKSVNGPVSDLKKAAMFYVLNRCSFSGTSLSGGMSLGHPRFTLEGAKSLPEVNFYVEKLSFEESIPKAQGLIYADPPYYKAKKLYGDKGDLHEGFNHLLLSGLLKDRGNFILSYDNCEEIKDLYAGHKFYFPEWQYGMSKDKKSSEILIVSKDI